MLRNRERVRVRAMASLKKLSNMMVMEVSVVRYSMEELSDFLLFKELDDDIVDTISKKIGGKEFMALTDDLRKMFPIIGERVKVRELIDEFSGKPEEVQVQVS